jgi:hypothetical protein
LIANEGRPTRHGLPSTARHIDLRQTPQSKKFVRAFDLAQGEVGPHEPYWTDESMHPRINGGNKCLEQTRTI